MKLRCEQDCNATFELNLIIGLKFNWIEFKFKKMGCKLVEKVSKVFLWMEKKTLKIQKSERHLSMPLHLGMD
jgi:hypothetical protein